MINIAIISLEILKILKIICAYVYLMGCIHVSAGTPEGLELELQVIVSHLV